MHTNVEVGYQPEVDGDPAIYFITCPTCQAELEATRQKAERHAILSRPGIESNSNWTETEREARLLAARHMLATATDAEVERAVAALTT